MNFEICSSSFLLSAFSSEFLKKTARFSNSAQFFQKQSNDGEINFAVSFRNPWPHYYDILHPLGHRRLPFLSDGARSPGRRDVHDYSCPLPMEGLRGLKFDLPSSFNWTYTVEFLVQGGIVYAGVPDFFTLEEAEA